MLLISQYLYYYLQYKEIKGHIHKYAGLTFEGDSGKEVAFWRLT
jgi:hypothetical protein